MTAARLAGRRLWFVGIGGAGLSGYALLAHAWGAEVAGWDRVETNRPHARARASRRPSPRRVAGLVATKAGPRDPECRPTAVLARERRQLEQLAVQLEPAADRRVAAQADVLTQAR